MLTTTKETVRTYNWRIASLVCTLSALFYLYEFVLQVSPGVMTNELMRAFSVDAIGLSTISAFYYYAYASMQLPAGVLYDRFGPRRLLTIAILICAFGAIFFSATHSVVFASYGRFMMGLGSAFSFIGALLLIARWFPPQYFAFLAGIVQLMSSVGAITGEAPLATAIERYGWRPSLIFIAGIGFILSLVIWLVVRDQPPWETEHQADHLVQESSIKGLSKVVKSSQTWLIALYSFCIWGPILIFAVLWGVPYLVKLYNVSTAVASSAVSMVWIGIGIGSPLIGWYSDFIGRRCQPLAIAAIIGLISSIFILYVPGVSFVAMYFFLFLLGLAASGQSLAFGLVKDLNHPKFVGTAIGFNNMAVVAGGAIFQPLVGFLIQMLWTGEMLDGVPTYAASAYQKAMFLLPICFLISSIISMYFLKETHCRPAYK